MALLFLIPGVGETIRVIGRASISTDPALAESFVVNGKTPRTVIVVAVERVFYQCTKAVVRSKLWDLSGHVDRKSLPSAGTILAEISGGKIGGPGREVEVDETFIGGKVRNMHKSRKDRVQRESRNLGPEHDRGQPQRIKETLY